jgi:hypothetical protein
MSERYFPLDVNTPVVRHTLLLIVGLYTYPLMSFIFCAVLSIYIPLRAIDEPRQRTALSKSDPAMRGKVSDFSTYIVDVKHHLLKEKFIHFNLFFIDLKCLFPTRISALLIALFPLI